MGACYACGQDVQDNSFAIAAHQQAHENDRSHEYLSKKLADRDASLAQLEQINSKAWAQVSQARKAQYAAEENAKDYAAQVREQGPDTIADEAVSLVYGDRQAAYGHPSSDFTAMGRITAAILSRWLESRDLKLVTREKGDMPTYMPDIAPEVVALIMTAVKLSRQSASPKRDNLVDLIGYTLCADRIIEGEEHD